LVLYTDGIVEAENGAGELFGLARFVASLSGARGGEPGVLIDAALSSMKRFTSAAPLKDDLTVVVVGVS
jgi:sigma-B regulation protein RsbU (phosphoserine phosphatase)